MAWRSVGWCAALSLMTLASATVGGAVEREPVTISVIAVNPSENKIQVVPVRIDLPQEVTPGDVLEQGELLLEYDDDRSLYYVYRDGVELAPKETKVFQVTVRDLWFIPDEQLSQLTQYTGILVEKLKDSEYYGSARQLGDTVTKRLDGIAAMQNDETLGRKARIGAYRKNLLAIAKIKEDLASLEKLISFTGGPPVPELLEESPLKADAPSQTTTWLVIFLIVIFMGLLGGQFFFTWHRRTQVSQELAVVRQAAFAPGNGAGGGLARQRPSLERPQANA
ncbi:MAG: hypothetical protein HYY58_02715 [Candidatus Omnitrophica bacterium]|nr:hypothetical protein [Candidatus Omnitrophota bacterium]